MHQRKERTQDTNNGKQIQNKKTQKTEEHHERTGERKKKIITARNHSRTHGHKNDNKNISQTKGQE